MPPSGSQGVERGLDANSRPPKRTDIGFGYDRDQNNLLNQTYPRDVNHPDHDSLNTGIDGDGQNNLFTQYENFSLTSSKLPMQDASSGPFNSEAITDSTAPVDQNLLQLYNLLELQSTNSATSTSELHFSFDTPVISKEINSFFFEPAPLSKEIVMLPGTQTTDNTVQIGGETRPQSHLSQDTADQSLLLPYEAFFAKLKGTSTEKLFPHSSTGSDTELTENPLPFQLSSSMLSENWTQESSTDSQQTTIDSRDSLKRKIGDDVAVRGPAKRNSLNSSMRDLSLENQLASLTGNSSFPSEPETLASPQAEIQRIDQYAATTSDTNLPSEMHYSTGLTHRIEKLVIAPGNAGPYDHTSSLSDSRAEIYHRGDKAQRMRDDHLQSLRTAKDTLMQSVSQIKNLLQIQTTEQNPTLLAKKLLREKNTVLLPIRQQVSSLESATKEYFDILRSEVMKPENSSKRDLYLGTINKQDAWWQRFDQNKETFLFHVQKQICDVDNALAALQNKLQPSLDTAHTPEANPQQSRLSEQSQISLNSSSHSLIPGEKQSLVSTSYPSGNDRANLNLHHVQNAYKEVFPDQISTASYEGLSSLDRQLDAPTRIIHENPTLEKKPEPTHADELLQNETKLQQDTGLTADQFRWLVPIFDAKHKEYLKKMNEGKRQFKKRQGSDGDYTFLPTPEKRLLFVLVHERTGNTLSTMAQRFKPSNRRAMTKSHAGSLAETLSTILRETQKYLKTSFSPDSQQLAQKLDLLFPLLLRQDTMLKQNKPAEIGSSDYSYGTNSTLGPIQDVYKQAFSSEHFPTASPSSLPIRDSSSPFSFEEFQRLGSTSEHSSNDTGLNSHSSMSGEIIPPNSAPSEKSKAIHASELLEDEAKLVQSIGLNRTQFNWLVPIFDEKYKEHMAVVHPDKAKRNSSEARVQKASGLLSTPEGRLLFTLVRQKTNETRTARKVDFGISTGASTNWTKVLSPAWKPTTDYLEISLSSTSRELAKQLKLLFPQPLPQPWEERIFNSRPDQNPNG